MTTTTLLDKDKSWSKFTNNVQLGASFTSYKEAVEFALEEDLKNDTSGRVAELIEALPEQYNNQNRNDSSVGGNDAINPYWQFGVDDDIVHPVTSIGPTTNSGMGRVYSENYDRNQQILWLSMGVPKFTNLADFYKDSADTEVAQLMKTGEMGAGAALKLGAMLGSAGKLAFQLPFLPAILTWKLFNRIVSGPSTTKYYDFKPAMPLYFKMANTILAHLAVGMGLYGDGDAASQYASSGLPSIMEDGPDIYSILHKRTKRDGGTVRSTDDLISALNGDPEDESFIDKFTGGLLNTATGAFDYLGFKIERSTDTSETVSNTTGASSIVQSLNSASSNIKDKKFTMADGIGISIIDGAVSTVKDLTKGVLSSLGAGGAVEVLSGNGYYDIPDVWQDSTFSKSYNFNLQLRSRYGDPVSIYQSIYVPLALLLAAALPRGIGTNMYTSPFIIRGYCKGMFSIPLGIIESLTIKRGLPEFGWSADNLPTAVDVTINIKDLSPAMFLSLGDPSIMDAFKHNDGLHEYLSTLSGLGVYERMNHIEKFQKKLKATGLMTKSTLLNPMYWGMTFGSGTLPRALGKIPTWSRVPNN